MSKLRTFIPFAFKLLQCLLYVKTKQQNFRLHRIIPTTSPIFLLPNVIPPVIGLKLKKLNCKNLSTNLSNFEAEQQITELISRAEDLIAKHRINDAKRLLDQAFKVAEREQAFGSITHVCDLQALIAFKDGGIIEAENSLVQSIEKLLQLGFTEDHNSIVRFKLKLARLYQMMGYREMAEFGFKDCIRVQETKLSKSDKFPIDSPEFTLVNDIYMSALYWYGKLLQDECDFPNAKTQYTKCLKRMNLLSFDLPHKTLSETLASQKMVLLYELADVDSNMKDYDGAITYLFEAIEICLKYVPKNTELPLYMIQVGMMFLKKGSLDGGNSWCNAGLELATKVKNEVAVVAAQDCLEALAGMKMATEGEKKN